MEISSAIEDAKRTIYAALSGLLLAITSWVIIGTINPDVLVVRQPDMPPTAGYGSGTETTQCAFPFREGTEKTPCKCIDDPEKEIYKKDYLATVPTTLTLTVSPSTTSTGNDVTFSGKLTNSTTGSGISSIPIRINRINTTLDASNTLNVTTDGTGNFTFTFSATCSTGAGADQIQTVFLGGSTNISSGSDKIDLTVSGASTCVYPTNYNDSPAADLFPYGNSCQNICSNKDLASDGEYHCLKAGVKIGWIAGNPSDYTDKELRAMAVSDGTDASPFRAYDGSNYIFEVEKYTTSLYPIVEYTADKDYQNGDCEEPLTDTGWNKSTAVYGTASPGTSCINSTTPLAETCSQKFCVKDARGNQANAMIYYSILKK